MNRGHLSDGTTSSPRWEPNLYQQISCLIPLSPSSIEIVERQCISGCLAHPPRPRFKREYHLGSGYVDPKDVHTHCLVDQDHYAPV